MGVGLSILVTVHNRADLTRVFLGSLLDTLPAEMSAEILVFDDQSSDETAALLASFGDRIRVLRGDRRGCFGANMNRLAGAASGERLVLLNNDMFMLPGWLGPMLAVADRERAGVVGNQQVYPGTDKINHAGGAYDRELTPVNLYEGFDRGIAPARAVREMQFVTGACWVVEAGLFASLGGFDEAYVNGYEDADFCLRVIAAGRSVWYCGQSVVEHHGSSTPGRFGRHAENRRVFLDRWRGRVEPDLERITLGDGVRWPVHSPALVAVRKLVRMPGFSWVAQRASVLPGAPGMRRWLRERLSR